MASAPVSFLLIKPECVATVRLMVSEFSKSGGAIYQRVADCPVLFIANLPESNLSYTEEEIQERTKLSYDLDTGIVSIQFMDEQPKRASRAAREIARSTAELVTENTGKDNIGSVFDAVVSNKPAGSKICLNIAMAAVLGFMLAVGTVLFKHGLVRTLGGQQETRYNRFGNYTFNE